MFLGTPPRYPVAWISWNHARQGMTGLHSATHRITLQILQYFAERVLIRTGGDAVDQYTSDGLFYLRTDLE